MGQVNTGIFPLVKGVQRVPKKESVPCYFSNPQLLVPSAVDFLKGGAKLCSLLIGQQNPYVV